MALQVEHLRVGRNGGLAGRPGRSDAAMVDDNGLVFFDGGSRSVYDTDIPECNTGVLHPHEVTGTRTAAGRRDAGQEGDAHETCREKSIAIARHVGSIPCSAAELKPTRRVAS